MAQNRLIMLFFAKSVQAIGGTSTFKMNLATGPVNNGSTDVTTAIVSADVANMVTYINNSALSYLGKKVTAFDIPNSNLFAVTMLQPSDASALASGFSLAAVAGGYTQQAVDAAILDTNWLAVPTGMVSRTDAMTVAAKAASAVLAA